MIYIDGDLNVRMQLARLMRYGVRVGDCIFLIGWNSLEWVINFWVCLYVGVIFVLVNVWWSVVEIVQGMVLI